MRKIFLGSYATEVNAFNFQGWNGHLDGVMPDILDSGKLATQYHFETDILANNHMSAEGLVNLHKKWSENTVAGDTVLWYHSGHGADKISDGGEGEVLSRHNDAADEAMVAFDRLITDNQVRRMLAMYKPGVNLIVVFDTCFSEELERFAPMPDGHVIKSAPAAVVRAVTSVDGWDWSPTYALLPKDPTVKANLIWIGACRADQTSADLGTNGLFTKNFLEAFKPGLTWKQWFQAAKKKMPRWQQPVFTAESKGAKTLAKTPALI